jgi:hypothetical protein
MGGEAGTTAADTARHSYHRRSSAGSRALVATAAVAACTHGAIAASSVEEDDRSD